MGALPTSEPITVAAEELCADWPRAGPRGWASPDPLDQEDREAPGHVRKLPFVRKRSLKNTGPALCASHVLSHRILTEEPVSHPLHW